MKTAGKAIAVCAAVVTAAAAAAALDFYITFRKPNADREAVVYIYDDYGPEDALEAVERSGVVRNTGSLRRAAEKRDFASHFEPGRYLIKEGYSNQYIVRMICNGWQEPEKFTMRAYIRTMDRLAGFLGENFEADSAEFAEALQDTALMKALGFRKEDYIGMFIPDTYQIYWTVTPEEFLKRMKREYDRFWGNGRSSKAGKMGMTPNEVTTLASIVVEETKSGPEMRRIAGVYINRLKRGMPLQACPTVIYAHLDTEPGIRRVLDRHLKIDSPYNTYIHRGLPPGPITIPPAAGIDAVLDYEKSDYLYFCARPELDGTHNFASTYAEHRRNSRAYNKAVASKRNS